MSYIPIENNIDIYEEEMEYNNSNSNSNSNNVDNANGNNIGENGVEPNTVIEIHDNFSIEEEDVPSLIPPPQKINFFKQFFLKRVYTTAIVAFLSLFLLNIINSVMVSLFIKDIKNTNEEDIELLTKLHPFIMISYACILGPILEELIFRKLFFGVIKKFSKILAYIVSCFLFAFGHFGFSITTLINEIYNFPIYFLAGAILAYAYDYDGYLAASIVAHIVYNSSMVTITFLFINENATK